MIDYIKEKLSNGWQRIKNWSGWATAGSIFKARMEALAGLIAAAIASLTAFDWMPFLSDSIDWMKMAMIAAYLTISGVVGEIVRRSGTKTVQGQLIPTAASVAPVKIKTKVPKKKKKNA